MDLRRAVPILSVENLPEAVALYRDVFGLDVLMDHGWIATLGSGGAAQFSLTTADATASENADLSLEVDDVDAAHAAVVAAGLEIVHPLTDEEWGVRRFFFRDADKNVVNVLSHSG
jgi:catechol 2,3-dioxygenase-like lactoylglutathione lyase family enzyme